MHTYIECNNLLNTEIDDACLTELGKAFHRVMTLGTNLKVVRNLYLFYECEYNFPHKVCIL